LGGEINLHAEIFIPEHGCVEVVILEVNGHEFCVVSGYDAIKEKFDCKHVGCGGATVAKVIDEVASLTSTKNGSIRLDCYQ
jgi:hypothetical protein